MKYLVSIDWNKTGLLYIFQKDKLLREKTFDYSTFFLWTDHAKIHKGAIILSTVIGCGFDPWDLQNIRVCEFRLEFLSYLKKKKKKKKVIGNEEVIPNIFACMPICFKKKKKKLSCKT
jgi:hypothetical protein